MITYYDKYWVWDRQSKHSTTAYQKGEHKPRRQNRNSKSDAYLGDVAN